MCLELRLMLSLHVGVCNERCCLIKIYGNGRNYLALVTCLRREIFPQLHLLGTGRLLCETYNIQFDYLYHLVELGLNLNCLFDNDAGMVDGMEKGGYPMFMFWTQVFSSLWDLILSLKHTIDFYALKQVVTLSSYFCSIPRVD